MTGVYKNSVGNLSLEIVDGNLCRCQWCDDNDCDGACDVSEADRLCFKEVCRQLDEYFDGTRRTFDIPLQPSGTPFRIKVWDRLRAIPYGSTVTYGQLAEAVNCPGGQRAVALACGANPIAVIVPCHRVVGANGSLGGYTTTLSGRRNSRTLHLKLRLLTHESQHK